MVIIIMKKSEFVVKIENGRDIMFNVGNRHYTIITWLDDGIGIGEQNKPKNEISVYPDADTLLKEFLVDGRPLGDLTEKIIITDYS